MITPRSFLHGRKPAPSSSPSCYQTSAPPSASNPRSSRSAETHFNEIYTDRVPPLHKPDTQEPPTAMATVATRPTTPSSAVQIPVQRKHKTDFRRERQRSSSGSRARDIHSPDAIPPSVAALLAITNIPPPSRRRSLRQREKNGPRMTVDSIVPRSKVSEKDLSQELRFDLNADLYEDDSSLASFERSPLDFLLAPLGDLGEEVASVPIDSCFASPSSTRTGSFDSLPSLGDASTPSDASSACSPMTPRGGKFRSPKRSLKPVASPPGELPEDPLSKLHLETDKLALDSFDINAAAESDKQTKVLVPFKSAFKSNLTASLRALRSAARSLSSFTTSSIPPDDLLTRSILTIDPRVPFTDERMPPVLEEEPSEAMRRYLNPSSNVRPEARGSSPSHSYTASIQMQTYRVQRSRSVPRTARQTVPSSNSSKASTVAVISPGPRQREMRENPDFIRVAVMEHLMRKGGKLDDQREGHARWLLPPRKTSSKPYEIGPGGVPVRWIPMFQDD
ncbi:hypothetical protein F5Y17DRAFT_40605 [Xylariaceae sp. FL0594]|nr:hypothetical protein F5Y17DRAFT_40605 [Xylariaceae sp. FL0594]